MSIWQQLILIIWMTSLSTIFADQDIAISWNSVALNSNSMSVTADLKTDGKLRQLRVSIKEKNIDIPERCLEDILYPLLQEIAASIGKWPEGLTISYSGLYWELQIPHSQKRHGKTTNSDSLIFSENKLLYSGNREEMNSNVISAKGVCES